MTPDQRRELEDLKRRIALLERVENPSFVELLKRLGTGAASAEDGAATTNTTINVRNAADAGSETVAAEYDGVLTLTDSTGATYRIGYYT